ncbi:hypothetical protein [Phaeobacter sp. HF9A]|uniref:hypothetical protein n=1 Tax=Phaeobacter sp. HF9A TaxID=2721561 RepID=UPI00143220D9|nr:hypothetical protein [Phaeobacter sp. HF9A]NIZ12354.1 hypothetical protein [Phaeobacter sp. HF9A]
MPLSALPATHGLKKALRLVTARMPALLSPRGLHLPQRVKAARPAMDVQLDQVLSIPVPDRNAENEAEDAAIAEGQFLARQDRWREVEARIRAADGAQAATPEGMPIADLIAYGARADVVNAVEHALSEGLPLTDRITLDGIMALERIRLDLGRGVEISTLVALAHLDIAWACRRTADAQPRQQAPLQARAAAHQKRAEVLLAPLAEAAAQRPFVTAARCALYCAQEPATPRRIADDYCALIRLDPLNPRHMRALGSHLVEQGKHGLSALDLEARRVAALVEPQWGAAGYTWVYFDALARSDAACLTVDVQFFLDGIADIVERRPSQDRVNLLSAYCSVALKPADAAMPDARQVRAEVAEAANWLIRNHLRELNPMIWAHAAAGFDNDAPVRSLRHFAERGRSQALRAIADLFREEIDAGCRVVFTPEGPEVMAG